MFSSYRFYAYGEPMQIPLVKPDGTKKWINLIDPDPCYEGFGLNSTERQKNYREFILGIDDERVREKLKCQDGGVLGSERFKKEMTEIIEKLGMLVKPKKRGGRQKAKIQKRPQILTNSQIPSQIPLCFPSPSASLRVHFLGEATIRFGVHFC
jgi:hypothetical protein